MNAVGLLLVVAVLLTIFIVTLHACAADARRRGKSPLLVTVLILTFFPAGLICWLVFRPEIRDEWKFRPFRLQDHRVQ